MLHQLLDIFKLCISTVILIIPFIRWKMESIMEFKLRPNYYIEHKWKERSQKNLTDFYQNDHNFKNRRKVMAAQLHMQREWDAGYRLQRGCTKISIPIWWMQDYVYDEQSSDSTSLKYWVKHGIQRQKHTKNERKIMKKIQKGFCHQKIFFVFFLLSMLWLIAFM